MDIVVGYGKEIETKDIGEYSSWVNTSAKGGLGYRHLLGNSDLKVWIGDTMKKKIDLFGRKEL